MDIFQLVPKGKLWLGKNIRKLYLAMQDTLRRAYDEVNKILIECIPTTANLLLADWMRVCNSKTREGMLSTLRAVGGNTEAFFEAIAKQFDRDCQILKNNPQDQFVTGMSSAGMSLGAQSIPKFCVVFSFSVNEPIEEAERLLNKLKPAHVRFIFIYPNLKIRPFVAGKSCTGDSLNFYKEFFYA